MSMLFQQIRRATYSRRGTALSHTFSRFCSTYNRALGSEKEETLMKALGPREKDALKNGLAFSFFCGTFYWVDYGGQRKNSAELRKLKADYDKESKRYKGKKKELDVLREKLKGTSAYNWSG